MSETSEFADLFKYLERKEYPSGMNKDQKRRLREKAAVFEIHNSELYHKGHKGRLGKVIVDGEEKNRILRGLHNDPVGGSHYGQTATLVKVWLIWVA